MLITKFIEIDMGHRVTNHKSKCRNFHGHRYKIMAGVDDKVIATKGASDEGMVIDFGDLKEILMEKIDTVYDHGFVLYKDDPYADTFSQIGREDKQRITLVDFVPTAENLAKHWFEIVEKPLQERGIKLRFIKVWETPTSTATYEPGGVF